MEPFPVEKLRDLFPGLARRVGGEPVVFLDGPAGSQVPVSVIDAVSGYLRDTNANHGGPFVTSVESDAVIQRAREAIVDLLGTDDPDLVVFGANMTTLTIGLARAFGTTLRPGDEVLLSRLEHDANYTPWAQAARDAGGIVREIAIRPDDCTLDIDDLRAKLSERTRLVAVGAASNAVGTINPVREIADLAHSAGALLFVDAVHYAPHAVMDVAAWDCDFLACSAYKFFGPHVGILWGRRRLLEELPVTKLRPPPDTLPDRWMTGTQSHEGIAGTLAAVEYLAGLGPASGSAAGGRRRGLVSAFDAIRGYENGLAARLLEGLSGIAGVRVLGIDDPRRIGERVPTVSITIEDRSPRWVAETLAGRGIFLWHGNFYALPLSEALGLEPDGMVRIGLLHYNTAAEVDRLLGELRALR